MKKILFAMLSLILLAPTAVLAQNFCGPIVPPECQNGCTDIKLFFQMLANIYNFIVKCVASPLAVIALVIGGIFMMLSAGNPNLHATGKKIIITAIIGLALVFCSWLIINFILVDMLGFQGNWANPF